MKKIAIFGSAVLLLGIAVLVLSANRAPKPPRDQTENKNPDFHYAYFMQKEFYTGIENPGVFNVVGEDIKGGIVSHHFYVEREIAKYFNQFGKNRPNVVVILGANHFNAGQSDLLVSNEAYQTPWGLLEPEVNIISKLIESNLVKNEEEPFEKEYSISNLVSFVKYKFPNAKLVLIIIKRNTPPEKMDALAEALKKFLPSDNLVLASADFSHNVTNSVALQQDKKTIDQIKKFELGKIYQRTPNELDNPPVIYGLLKYLEIVNAKNMEYWNLNSAIYSGNLESTNVTSYVFAYFHY